LLQLFIQYLKKSVPYLYLTIGDLNINHGFFDRLKSDNYATEKKNQNIYIYWGWQAMKEKCEPNLKIWNKYKIAINKK